MLVGQLFDADCLSYNVSGIVSVERKSIMHFLRSGRIASLYLAAGFAFLCVVLLVSPVAACAQSGSASFSGGVLSSTTPSSATALDQATVEQYWTPQRPLNAKPVELHPQVGADGLPIAPQSLADTALPEGNSGAPPLVKVPPNAGKVLIPSNMLLEPRAQSGVIAFATSSFGA